jgi:prevent-host-death family protein
MYYFEEASALVGVSELRTRLDEILKLAKKATVFLRKRDKPVAVLVPIEQYRETEAFLEHIEDTILGHIAMERMKNAKPSDFMTLEELEEKIGLRKKSK